MSSTSFGRRRERRNPVKTNIIKIGILYKRRNTDGVAVSSLPITSGSWSLASSEVTWDSVHKGPPYVTGGPFASVKAVFDVNSIRGVGSHKGPPGSAGGGFYWHYVGGFNRPLMSWENITLNSAKNLSVDNPFDSDLLDSIASLGPSAYDKLRPRAEEAGASVFIAELRDLSGMLKTSAAFFKNRWQDLGGNRFLKTMAGSPKEASDHFLNHQFGWVPFVNDLIKFYAVWQKYDEILKRKAAENGIWIKVNRTVSKEETFTTTHTGDSIGIPWRPEFNSMCNAFPGTSAFYRLTQTESNSTRIWAAGEFTYYRPEFDINRTDYESNWQEANRLLTLYGVRINPSVLWKVTPWTWLFDWFSGFGAWLDRLQSFGLDGVASKYMYIMKRSLIETQHIVDVNWKDNPSTFVWTHFIDSKQREEADNPFSYTLPVGGLSPKQFAIMAALGLGRWWKMRVSKGGNLYW